METVELNMLKRIFDGVRAIKEELVNVRQEINEIKDLNLDVRPEYLKKLDKINKQKGKIYHSMEEFDKTFGV